MPLLSLVLTLLFSSLLPLPSSFNHSPIPKSELQALLTSLLRLRSLFLHSNSLSGPIPFSLSLLPNLLILNFPNFPFSPTPSTSQTPFQALRHHLSPSTLNRPPPSPPSRRPRRLAPILFSSTMDKFLNNKIHHHLFDLNHSAVASNSSSGSTTTTLTHPASDGCRLNSSNARPTSQNDALARILMDPNHPTIPLEPQYNHWTIHLPLRTMGPAFAQGTLGKLYRGTYANLVVNFFFLEGLLGVIVIFIEGEGLLDVVVVLVEGDGLLDVVVILDVVVLVEGERLLGVVVVLVEVGDIGEKKQ